MNDSKPRTPERWEATKKVCHCGAQFNSETRDECLSCAGWACPAPSCGRSKTPESVHCGRVQCRRWYTRTQAQRDGVDAQRKVLPMTTRGQRR